MGLLNVTDVRTYNNENLKLKKLIQYNSVQKGLQELFN